jgi:hypothetical protein
MDQQEVIDIIRKYINILNQEALALTGLFFMEVMLLVK